MPTPELILIQFAISLFVVALYHLWVSRKQPSTLPNLNPNPSSASPASALAPPIPTPPKTVPASDQMTPEIVAVIAAAISVVLGRSHRVVSVQQASAARTTEINVWSLEGRLEQFKSHKVR
jgi:hypothetical protein